MKNVYAALAVAGFFVPIVTSIPFSLQHGADAGLFLQQFTANDGGRLLLGDLFVSSLAFWAFLFPEARRLGIRGAGWFVVANLAIGLCFAFPLFLFVRAQALERREAVL
jgi:hypothetical protein